MLLSFYSSRSNFDTRKKFEKEKENKQKRMATLFGGSFSSQVRARSDRAGSCAAPPRARRRRDRRRDRVPPCDRALRAAELRVRLEDPLTGARAPRGLSSLSVSPAHGFSVPQGKPCAESNHALSQTSVTHPRLQLGDPFNAVFSSGYRLFRNEDQQ